MTRAAHLGPFKQVHLPQGTIRYRQLGSGQPVVFVHGLLVNGDLWRKVVPPLSTQCRCIVPDLPLGSHEIALKEDADLSPSGLAQLLSDFLTALDLEGTTLVANDAGGALLRRCTGWNKNLSNDLHKSGSSLQQSSLLRYCIPMWSCTNPNHLRSAAKKPRGESFNVS